MKKFTLLKDKQGLDLLREHGSMGYGKYSLNYWKDKNSNEEYVIYTYNKFTWRGGGNTVISNIEKIKGK